MFLNHLECIDIIPRDLFDSKFENNLHASKNSIIPTDQKFLTPLMNKFKAIIYPMTDQKIINTYLVYHFKTSNDRSNLEKIFDNQKLTDIQYKTKLQLGEKMEKINEVFGEEALEKLRKKKTLEWVEYNKKHFEQDENIVFKVKVKNINNLTVNVFEINAENYYRKNMKEIPSDIDLEGLIPAESQNMVMSENPIMEVEKEVN